VARPPGRAARSDRERRRHQRYRPHQLYHVRTTALSERGLDRPGARPILGRIHDIGAGGLCLLSKQMVTVPQLLRCDILLPGVPASVPTLVRVRWCVKDPRRAGYKAGAEFLLG
jgi:PilZ domain